MSAKTEISWCDSTFNPWIGCTKVSPACDHCYAERDFDLRRHVVQWGAGKPRKRTSVQNWNLPLRWNREHDAFFAENGHRRRVFCASLADVFDNEVNPSWRADLFALIEATPSLDWLLLTKRIGNVQRMMIDVAHRLFWMDRLESGKLPSNVWLGATICNQQEADRDIPKLLRVPAAVRFLSIEPMLGSVDLTDIDDGAAHREIPREFWTSIDSEDSPPSIGLNALTGERWQRFGEWSDGGRGIDWVICGGESGPQARPMSPDWARSLRDQCKAAGVPFLFKQWGEWIPMLGQVEGVAVRHEKATTPDGWVMGFAGKKAAGNLLDGVAHNEFPLGAS